jgi:hypothetical protein
MGINLYYSILFTEKIYLFFRQCISVYDLKSGKLVFYPEVHQPWVIYPKLIVHGQITDWGLKAKHNYIRPLVRAGHDPLDGPTE